MDKILFVTKSSLIFIFLVILVWIIWKSINVVLLFFAAYVLASALFPIIDKLSKKIPRWIAVLLVYLAGLVIIVAGIIPLANVVIRQIMDFIRSFPDYLTQIEAYLLSWGISYREITNFLPDLSRAFNYIISFSQTLLQQSVNIILTLFTFIVAIFTLAVIIAYILLDRDKLNTGFLKLFPRNIRNKAENIGSLITEKVGRYVIGQLILMIIIGIMVTIGLFILGVDYAILLGVIAGLLEFIPILGPVISAIPAVLIALAQDPWLALWTVLLYLVIQRIENSFLAPYILGKALEIHPLMILAALLVAASTLGLLGVILSPAIAAVLYILINELYIKPVNQKKPDQVLSD